MKLISKIILPLIFSECAFANTIYGIEHIEQHQYSIKQPIFVQMGSFRTSSAAEKYQRQLKMQTNQKVSISHTSGNYQVRIGPFNDYSSLKKLAQKLHQSTAAQPKQTLAIIPPAEETPVRSKTSNSVNWFVNAQGGLQKMGTPSATRVNNGSGFATPFDQDLYTANHSGAKGLFGLQIGRRWELTNPWFSAFSLGAQYEYFLNSDVNGQVIQFTLPQFTNYTYKWQTASNLIAANAKVNLLNYQRFSPYINLGAGAVLHQGSYSEVALANVTPRISPSYKSNSSAQFAYILGAGLDYQFKPELIMSAGYQYSDLGMNRSGYGTLTWSAERLNLGQYHSNAFLVGLTYLFESNTHTS